eukprot:313746-Amphidinium_carterae.3
MTGLPWLPSRWVRACCENLSGLVCIAPRKKPQAASFPLNLQSAYKQLGVCKDWLWVGAVVLEPNAGQCDECRLFVIHFAFWGSVICPAFEQGRGKSTAHLHNDGIGAYVKLL